MPLVFLPAAPRFFLWGEDSGLVPGLERGGAPERVELVTPEGRRVVEGLSLPLLDATAKLAIVPTQSLEFFPASLTSWALASKLALELVSRERIVPTIARHAGRIEARWAAALSASEDARNVAALAQSMPPASHAVPVAPGTAPDVWAPDALLRAYLDAVVDALVRSAKGAPELELRRPSATKTGRWEQRWQSALEGSETSFDARGFGERTLIEGLERWSEPAVGARDRLRACFRLELPEKDRAPFVLRFLLQSPDDPSLLVPAADVWKTSGRSLEKLGRAFRDPQESLLEALGRAARLFAPIERALDNATPELIALDPAMAFSFLGDGAAALAEAGFGVIVPAELTASGRRRLRLRMRVGSQSKVAGAVAGATGLGLDALVAVDWEAAIGDKAISFRELTELAKQKAPLVRHRGTWVAIDPAELAEIQKRIASGSTELTMREAVRAALAGETREGSLSVTVAATGAFQQMLDRMRAAPGSELEPPASLRATLRPYQKRGVAWLSTMGSLGLGACLADDMGLGKTVQLIAFLLRLLESTEPEVSRPTLIVAPTSVVGNWEREISRFAPSLSIARHYGADRVRSPTDFPRKRGTLVITSYGLLRRDVELLAEVEWSAVVLDEAQNIKNAASATARATRALRASHRFALTGTPVENRLAELWSILEFVNPGLLGPLEAFRREFAVPIERYANEDAAERLRRIVGPFLLRRLKSDPAVISDLPPKNEMKMLCTLTREQATLYKAVVDQEMRRIESADGIERRGRVLALMLFLKQICNHPAHYLSESGPLAKRSGKLARITEMLEEAMLAGDKALVFTQFKEMGDRLLSHLGASLGCEVVFLHGGTPRKSREEMVWRFQNEAREPRIFVLSLKAGGTGLNLTAANHVFHYDRWWNPAVEDQATDRAYRIGQKRAVQVHKLVCAGTVEEKVDRLLENKRKLSAKVVEGGERWITELSNGELKELFTLSTDAPVGADERDDETVSRGNRRARAPAARRTEDLA